MGVLAVFDRQGRWGDTHVCDSRIAQHLVPAGVSWGPQGSAAPARVAAEENSVRLYYLPVDAGHLGVLCEPGEWIGPAPGAGEGVRLREALQTPPGLPAIDDFIAHMLVLTGHSDDED